MHQLYEIVVFTDSSGGLADQVITSLDPNGYIMYRLYRDATKFEGGKHIKDLSCMNRPIEHIVMVDDNPDSVSLQPENSILVKKYSIGDGEGLQDDNVLPELAPFLVALATQVTVLEGFGPASPLGARASMALLENGRFQLDFFVLAVHALGDGKALFRAVVP
ncbi:unnamed protein product [Choristocarpus tenellus]